MLKTQLIILVVDEQKEHADALVNLLESTFSKVLTAYSAEEALKICSTTSVNIVIADLNPGAEINGIQLMGQIKETNPEAEIIILSSSATIESCKEAMRKGAFDYYLKPVENDLILNSISQAADKFSDQHSDTVKVSVRPKIKQEFYYEGIKGTSPAMQSVFRIIKRVAPTDISVLIEGESGSGKELLARAIHNNSQRSDGPFCPINCAGLSETLLESELFGHIKGSFTGAATDRKGLFETADKGTLFLDELGDMPLSMQAKLLRVLEDGIVVPVGSNKGFRVDVRVVSATNHDLAKKVEQGDFRQDLYFRIKGVSVTIPPLRRRPDDLKDMIYFFLDQSCEQLGIEIKDISESAMAVLLSYDWPGNIRQLRNAIRTIAVMCEGDVVRVNDIPPDIHSVPKLAQGSLTELPMNFAGKTLNELEREAIQNTLLSVEGNREKAAKMLGIGERTLYRKIKEYEL